LRFELIIEGTLMKIVTFLTALGLSLVFLIRLICLVSLAYLVGIFR
jgi:hypothetical protein